MSDFALCQALDCSPAEEEDTFEESACFGMKDTENEIFTLDEGVDLMVTHNRKTMRSVALLVLGVNRMKNPPMCRNRKLSNDEVYNMIMDNMVEETVWDPVTTKTKLSVTRANSEKEFTLCDISKKDLVLSGEFRLEAITLKGGNDHHRVNIKMSRYCLAAVSPGDTQTVVLSVNNLYISCSMEDNKAVLNLEQCHRDILQVEDMTRFLFFKKITGTSVNTFESVKFRGWFISTSECENQPVELCQVDTAKRVISFTVNSPRLQQ